MLKTNKVLENQIQYDINIMYFLGILMAKKWPVIPSHAEGHTPCVFVSKVFIFQYID